MSIFRRETRKIKNDTKTLPQDTSENFTGREGWFWYSPRMSLSQMLANTSVNACVSIIADSIASLSCNVYKKTDAGRIRADDIALFNLLHSRPNYDDVAFTFWQKIMFCLLLKGNAFIFVERNSLTLEPRKLEVLDPDKVDIRRDNNKDVYFVYHVNGKEYHYNTEKILHIPAYRINSERGVSPLEYSASAAKLGLTLDEYTNESFDGGYHQKIALEIDDDVKRNWKKEDSKALIEQFKLSFGGKDKQNDPIVVAKAKIKPLDLPSNADAQLAENRKYSEKEIAKIYRVPLFMLGSENSKFTNMEQANTFFLVHCLNPWLVRLQQYFNRLLITGQEDYYVEFDTDTMLRADYNTRWANHRQNFQAGLFTLNDIMEMENLPRIQEDYGNVHFGLENYKPLSTAMNEDADGQEENQDDENDDENDKKKD